jgi:MFS family permease
MSYAADSTTGSPGSAEFRRHWRLLLAATAGVICSSVVLPFYTIGTLLKPVTAEFGWSRAEFQSAILFSATLGALAGPLVGWLIDRHGSRRIALVGLVGLSLGFFAAASMNGQLWVFYAAYACMALLGAGTTPITWTRAVGAAFSARRGLALGLALSGTGLCAMAAPLFTVWLLEHFGWRGAYIGLGLLPLLFAGPLVLWGFRERGAAPAGPQATEAAATGISVREALRGYHFWVLLLSVFLAYLAVSGIGPNLVPALTDKGRSPTEAALLQGVYGASIIGARILVGLLLDRFWAPAVAAASLLLPVIGCLLLTGAGTLPWQVLAMALIGFAAGAELDVMSYLAARYFGMRHYGAIYALLYAALAVCSGTAPALFALVQDRSGSYDAAFAGAAVLFLLSAAVVLALGRYPRFDPPADTR